MKKNCTKKLLLTLFLLISVFVSHTAWVDSLAEEYTEQGIKRTLITYAISRSLNGVISVAQGTEVALSPAGVGLTFTPGQILDPVNDLIERFSWVVLVSGSSLGIQRLFLEITSSATIVWLLTLLVVIYLSLYWFYSKNNGIDINKWLLKSVVLFIFVRFAVPSIALVNEGLYLVYLQPQYVEAQLQLESVSNKINLINESSKEQVKKDNDDGFSKTIEKWLDKTQQAFDVERKMNSLEQAAADVSHQVINMIVVFVVQTLVFPLLFLWILVKGTKGIIRRI